MSSPYSQLSSSNQSNNDIEHHIDEAIRNLQKVLQIKTKESTFQLYYSFYIPLIHAPINIPKYIGFIGVSCDTCMSSTVDPIFSFDRLVSAVKTDHTCDSQYLSKIQNRTDGPYKDRRICCTYLVLVEQSLLFNAKLIFPMPISNYHPERKIYCHKNEAKDPDIDMG